MCFSLLPSLSSTSSLHDLTIFRIPIRTRSASEQEKLAKERIQSFISDCYHCGQARSLRSAYLYNRGGDTLVVEAEKKRMGRMGGRFDSVFYQTGRGGYN